MLECTRCIHQAKMTTEHDRIIMYTKSKKNYLWHGLPVSDPLVSSFGKCHKVIRIHLLDRGNSFILPRPLCGGHGASY